MNLGVALAQPACISLPLFALRHGGAECTTLQGGFYRIDAVAAGHPVDPDSHGLNRPRPGLRSYSESWRMEELPRPFAGGLAGR